MYDLVPNSPFYVNLWNQFYELGWLPIDTNTTFSVGGYYSVRGKERKGGKGSNKGAKRSRREERQKRSESGASKRRIVEKRKRKRRNSYQIPLSDFFPLLFFFLPLTLFSLSLLFSLFPLQTLLAPQLRLISLNTALYIVRNTMNVGIDDPANQVEFISFCVVQRIFFEFF